MARTEPPPVPDTVQAALAQEERDVEPDLVDLCTPQSCPVIVIDGRAVVRMRQRACLAKVKGSRATRAGSSAMARARRGHDSAWAPRWLRFRHLEPLQTAMRLSPTDVVVRSAVKSAARGGSPVDDDAALLTQHRPLDFARTLKAPKRDLSLERHAGGRVAEGEAPNRLRLRAF